MASEPIQFPAPVSSEEVGIRALPANLEAEAAFIGAALIDNRVIEEHAGNLRPQHFFEPLHQRIYERILQLMDRSAVVTPVTLKPYFEADEALRELGGITYLARLTADGQGLLAPRELAEQIYDLALLRELVSVGRNLVTGAMDTSNDAPRCSRSRKPRPRFTRSPMARAAGAKRRPSRSPRAPRWG